MRSFFDHLKGVPLKKLRITVMKSQPISELSERYETPQPFPCSMHFEGDVFYADGWQKPDGFCDSAWQTLSPFALALSHGAEGFYDGWMKNPRSAMLSCNDGFRPVTFLLEALDEDVD